MSLDEAGMPYLFEAPVEHFVLPRQAWVEFHAGLERRLDVVEPGYEGNETALAVVEACRTEIRMNRERGETYGYAFYVMRRA